MDSEQGASVAGENLYLIPVDPVIYKMKGLWGYHNHDLPCEPFEIEIKIQSEYVLEGLKVFKSAIEGYLSSLSGCTERSLYLEKLLWSGEMTETVYYEILMSG